MAKILSLTILLIALIASAHAINLKEVTEQRAKTTALFTIGEDDDFQILGFSIRGIIFRFLRSFLKGYIAGYEGRYSVPGECLDVEFQKHVSSRAWSTLKTVFTFWKHSGEVITNQIVLFLIVVADEVMND